MTKNTTPYETELDVQREEGIALALEEQAIERMRAYLARQWGQSKSQVTDVEAKHYLAMECYSGDSRFWGTTSRLTSPKKRV